MKFLLAGVGSMGSTIAAHLQYAGEDVLGYDTDEETVETIRSNGLIVERPDSPDLSVDIPITSDPDDFESVDVVIVMVKSPNTETAIQQVMPAIGETTSVVTLQNGLNNGDLIAKYVAEETVFSGTTEIGANTVTPGHVKMLGAGKSRIGGGDHDRANQIAERFSAVGFETVAVENPAPYIWDKQFLSIGIKPVAALTELRNGPMYTFPSTRTIMRQLVEEAIEVARAQDIEIISDDPVAQTFDIAERMYDKKSSMLEDVEKQRKTEIESINGAIVEYGEQVGVDTPYNQLVTSLVKGKEVAFSDPTSPDEVPGE